MTSLRSRARRGFQAAFCLVLYAAIASSQIAADPVPADKPAAFPDWWFSQAVIRRLNAAESTPSWPNSYPPSQDFAVLNQGQLKALATAAYDELADGLMTQGGAGNDVLTLVKSWYQLDNSSNLPPRGSRIAKPTGNDFRAVNLGQLKTVAKPFYDRLIALGLCPGYPWAYATSPAQDYDTANLGQAKNLFRFVASGAADTDGDGIPDWFAAALDRSDLDGNGIPDALEAAQAVHNGTNPGGFNDPNTDTDGDGLTNAEEYAAGTKYTGAGSTDSDGDGVPDGLDGWPNNPDLHPPRVPNTRFAVLPLTEIPAGANIVSQLGDGCQVLYSTGSEGNGWPANFSLWSPTGTKSLGGLGVGTSTPMDNCDFDGASPRMNQAGTKVAGAVIQAGYPPDYFVKQAAVWDATSETSTPLPWFGYPTTGSAGQQSEAFCVNDLGAAAGREMVYRMVTGEEGWVGSGLLWSAVAAQQMGKLYEEADHDHFPLIFFPARINNNGVVIGHLLTHGSSGPTHFGVSVSGAPPSTLCEIFDGGSDSMAINNLAQPWMVLGDLWVQVGSAWKKESIATWGKDGPQQPATGNVWGVNDRCEMIGYFWDAAKGKTANLVRNAQVFDINDLIDGYTVAGNLMALNNQGAILTYVTSKTTNTSIPAILLPVEMRITDRDDSKQKWPNNVLKTAPIYSGKTTGDMVSWKLGGTDSWTTTTFTWSAEGPESRTGPVGLGKNEWKIADGDADTDHDCIDWKAGKHKIKCQISSAGASSSTAEFEQEVGVRTDDVVVVGWIDRQQVPLSGTGVQAALTHVFPMDGIVQSDSEDAKAIAAQLLGILSTQGVGFTFALGPPTNRSVFTPFSSTDKTYTLNWMFRYGGNGGSPPDTFQDGSGDFSQGLLDHFAAEDHQTRYKLINHFQVKFLTSPNGLFRVGKLTLLKDRVYTGSTRDPSRYFEVSGLLAWLGKQIKDYPLYGVFPSTRGANNSPFPVTIGTETKLRNEARPDRRALDAFLRLTGYEQGEIWSSITFFSDLQNYSERISPSTNQSLTRVPKPARYHEGRMNTQVYPTYWIYINGELVGVQNQASTPSALFPNIDKAQ